MNIPKTGTLFWMISNEIADVSNLQKKKKIIIIKIKWQPFGKYTKQCPDFWQFVKRLHKHILILKNKVTLFLF